MSDSATSSTNIESLRYARGSLTVIDQLKLPEVLEYVDVNTVNDAWSVIRTMQVRGAPLIAIVAMLGLAVDVHNKHNAVAFSDVTAAVAFLREGLAYLRTSRPTAVNLFTAAKEMDALIDELAVNPASTVASVVERFVEAAEFLWQTDVSTNKAMGAHGATHILALTNNKPKLNVLTICNTGSLATAGYGTALGVVRALHEQGRLAQVFACETRPYNQGARLTAFEIVHEEMPGTLITDSMAAYLMATKGIDVVVVGADRVAANGDTANKIGTYQLAIVAKHHNVPFFVVAPTTTLDLTMASGTEIHVEERPAHELTSIFGHQLAPKGINVWNPSFDVTPFSLISGVVTELGVCTSSKPGAIIDVPAFVASHQKQPLSERVREQLAQKLTNTVVPTDATIGFKRMTEKDIAEYIIALPVVHPILGITTDMKASDLSVTEVGDGNLNFVYIIRSPSGAAVVAKQALPYVRCVGESWPLTLERAVFETEALRTERKLKPEHVPEVFHFDRKLYVIVMDFVAPPHQILRKFLIAGEKITTFARDLGSFCASTLFGTSGLALSGTDLRTNISYWSRNTGLCALTEQVIFTDPYTESAVNRWTSPQLDHFASAIKADSVLKLAITTLKSRFLTKAEALLHADLHTGSVMCKEGSTFVIDPEFAFYGPIGFDIGAVLANLLLSFFAQSGLATAEGVVDRNAFAQFVLEQIVIFYDQFESEFIGHWNRAKVEGTLGEINLNKYYQFGDSDQLLALTQQQYLRSIFIDSIGFCGAKMLRRIVGIAHVADLESIEDVEKRSQCEKRALLLARELILFGSGSSSTSFGNINDVITAAKAIASAEVPTLWPSN